MEIKFISIKGLRGFSPSLPIIPLILSYRNTPLSLHISIETKNSHIKKFHRKQRRLQK